MLHRSPVAVREEDDPRLRLDVLSAPVGRNAQNDRLDVARVESLLGAHGYLDLDATDGPTGYAGARLEKATRRFQKDNALRVDGRLAPGGETILRLAQATPWRPDAQGRFPDGSTLTVRTPGPATNGHPRRRNTKKWRISSRRPSRKPLWIGLWIASRIF